LTSAFERAVNPLVLTAAGVIVAKNAATSTLAAGYRFHAIDRGVELTSVLLESFFSGTTFAGSSVATT
jgi:hypothetical protein